MFRTSLIVIAAFTLILAACQTSNNPDGISQNYAVSDCNGFGAAAPHVFKDNSNYCDAEILHWSYDASTQTLSLADNRILLNCCGDHEMFMTLEQGVYVVTERDAPQFGDARCGCMCVFDYTMEAHKIPLGQFPIRLVRDVTDWPEGSGIVYEGTLDLSQGSGAIVLDDTPEPDWCQEPTL